MTYRTVDTERSAKNQDLAQGSYDLVMALSLTSPDAIWDPEPTLTHIRHVLRPGGYIVMLILPSQGLATRGKADAYQYWDTLLRKTGFSGLDTDTITPAQQSQPGTASLFSTLLATQAEDDRVSFLHEPLPPAGKIPLSLESLTILGEDRDVSQKLARSVGAHYIKVQIVTSLSGEPDIPSGGTVVCFLELQPTGGSEGTTLTAPVLGIVQTMFRRARNILWVTSGARPGENPRGNMTKGLLRSVALEMSDRRTQFLDFATSDEVSAGIITKMLLRLEAYSVLEVEGRVKAGDML